jgi:hypothetical protein
MINYDELQKTIDSHIAANRAYMEIIQQLPDGRIHIPCAPPVLDIAHVRELIGQHEEKPVDIKQYTDAELLRLGRLSGKFGRIIIDDMQFRDMTDQEFERYKAAIQRRDGSDIMTETRKMLG